jgi:transmembrane sensor
MEEMYNRLYLQELAHKWKTGQLNETEKERFDLWEKSHQDDILNFPENSGGPEVVKARMLERLMKGMQEENPVKKQTSLAKLWPAITIAASLLIVTGIATYFYANYSNGTISNSSVAYTGQVHPGRDKAVLTLGNGTEISLTNAKNGTLLKEDGTTINKTAGGKLVYTGSATSKNLNTLNTITTPRGGKWELRLPDGSMVWLNAASSLTYPVSFDGSKERLVELKGEAYFEVARDKSHPFKVKTARQEVEVLGTHFNVESYPEEILSKTTLLTGSVRISTADQSALIKPGEQALLSAANKLSIINVDVSSAVAWKNGDFVFIKEDLKSVMRKISRWYDVEIIYQGDFSSKTFTGTVSRSENIDKALGLLELTGVVHFKIKGRSVIVMP